MLKSLAGKTKTEILSSQKQTSVEAASLGKIELKNSDWAGGWACNPSFLGTDQEDGQGLRGRE